MTNKLLDDDLIREGLTKLLLASKSYEQQIARELAEIRQRIDDLRNRVEILEVRQAGDERRIP